MRDHGAVVDAIDCSATQHQRARDRYLDMAGLNLLHGDAVQHLACANPYDLMYAVSVFPFVDPARLIPAVVQKLRPRGRLVFSGACIPASPVTGRRPMSLPGGS
ncbi:class I SAM-dependent methyltransferase [Streptomyces sp. NPDC001549]|uniref:class I SAM-dependent methyltransferase n=1 Tax=Streptomyces sp. NPDC001549 TaxID=3364586 RepID=UPI00368F5C37